MRRTACRSASTSRSLRTGLTAALLGGAVQRVAQAFERIDVAGRGSAGRFALDLHGARPLHGFDELGLNLGLFDEGVLILGKQLEFRRADRHRRLGTRAEGVA